MLLVLLVLWWPAPGPGTLDKQTHGVPHRPHRRLGGPLVAGLRAARAVAAHRPAARPRPARPAAAAAGRPGRRRRRPGRRHPLRRARRHRLAEEPRGDRGDRPAPGLRRGAARAGDGGGRHGVPAPLPPLPPGRPGRPPPGRRLRHRRRGGVPDRHRRRAGGRAPGRRVRPPDLRLARGPAHRRAGRRGPRRPRPGRHRRTACGRAGARGRAVRGDRRRRRQPAHQGVRPRRLGQPVPRLALDLPRDARRAAAARADPHRAARARGGRDAHGRAARGRRSSPIVTVGETSEGDALLVTRLAGRRLAAHARGRGQRRDRSRLPGGR